MPCASLTRCAPVAPYPTIGGLPAPRAHMMAGHASPGFPHRNPIGSIRVSRRSGPARDAPNGRGRLWQVGLTGLHPSPHRRQKGFSTPPAAISWPSFPRPLMGQALVRTVLLPKPPVLDVGELRPGLRDARPTRGGCRLASGTWARRPNRNPQQLSWDARDGQSYVMTSGRLGGHPRPLMPETRLKPASGYRPIMPHGVLH